MNKIPDQLSKRSKQILFGINRKVNQKSRKLKNSSLFNIVSNGSGAGPTRTKPDPDTTIKIKSNPDPTLKTKLTLDQGLQ